MAKVRAVLFDADGVLQRPAPSFEGRLQHAMGWVPDDLDAFFRDIFAAEAPCMVGAADFRERMRPVLAEWRPEATIEHFMDAWLSIAPNADVMALVQSLRTAGLICAIASNQERYRARHMSRALGYADAFDDEFYSCELGVAKPELGYFEAILARLEIAAERVLFIDDRDENVVAARRAGLRAARFELAGDGRDAEVLRDLVAGFGIVAGAAPVSPRY